MITASRLASLTGMSTGALYAQHKYTQWCEGLPMVRPHEGMLFASAQGPPNSCALCASVPAHLLLPGDAGSQPVSRRGNYATVEASLLQRTLDRLLRELGTDPPTTPAALTDFGAERLVGPSEAPMWVGASVRAPRWVGDDQLVLLCSGRPLEVPSLLSVFMERRRLHAAVTAITDELRSRRNG
eukprot:scaffold1369_cov140-Isochrysis_galbana.AAC.3